jgi:hypothetical protein
MIGRWPGAILLKWVVIALLAVVGTVLPFWVYEQARTAVSEVVGLPIGIGLGVWLNEFGGAAAILAALKQFFDPKIKIRD